MLFIEDYSCDNALVNINFQQVFAFVTLSKLTIMIKLELYYDIRIADSHEMVRARPRLPWLLVLAQSCIMSYFFILSFLFYA